MCLRAAGSSGQRDTDSSELETRVTQEPFSIRETVLFPAAVACSRMFLDILEGRQSVCGLITVFHN